MIPPKGVKITPLKRVVLTPQKGVVFRQSNYSSQRC